MINHGKVISLDGGWSVVTIGFCTRPFEYEEIAWMFLAIWAGFDAEFPRGKTDGARQEGACTQ